MLGMIDTNFGDTTEDMVAVQSVAMRLILRSNTRVRIGWNKIVAAKEVSLDFLPKRSHIVKSQPNSGGKRGHI